MSLPGRTRRDETMHKKRQEIKKRKLLEQEKILDRNTIINLSKYNYKLTSIEEKIVNKGLSFVPTQSVPNKSRLLHDLISNPVCKKHAHQIYHELQLEPNQRRIL